VAAFDSGLVFISECIKPRHAPVHCVFRRSFQTLRRVVPGGRSGESDQDPAPHPSKSGNSAGRRIGRARPIRFSRRQFVRRGARQFLRPRRFAGILQRRRHLGTWTSRRAFLRRFRRLSGLDRRVLLRIDRHFVASVMSSWRVNGAVRAMFRPLRAAAPCQRGESGRKFSRGPTLYCCGSCRSRNSRVRTCRRCSPPAIRSATDARSPPRGATARPVLA
jgi:hypothetical protein